LTIFIVMRLAAHSGSTRAIIALVATTLLLLTVRSASAVAVPFEVGEVVATSAPTTVSLCKTFTDPVVVCTPNLRNNSRPLVVRVDNVQSSSFDVWLQHAYYGAPVPERVWYIVMEAGAHDVGGMKCEAQKYLSTRTDQNNSWVAEQQTYLQSYTSPIVIGQVMSANDPEWSVFWSRGTSRTSPPSATRIYTGKHVGEDWITFRQNETVGFIVFEPGHYTVNGVGIDARRSSDSIRGVANGPPYSAPFLTSFATAPEVVVGSLTAMDGGDGGWMVVYGATPANTTRAYVAIDEDQWGDTDRSHTTEQVAVVAFERPLTQFLDVSSALGFDVMTTTDSTFGSGLHWGDLNADGWLDAIITGSTARMMLSNGGTSFFAIPFGGSVRRQGALLDIDNDDDLDFFAACDNSYNAETIFENDGSAGFADVSNLGFGTPTNNEGMAVADVNHDGMMDVVMFSGNGNWIGHNQGGTPVSLIGTSASSYGLNDTGDYGNGDYASSADVDDDGRVDFFYHYGNGKMFLSNGDGTYTEASRGVSVVTGNGDKFGSAWGDYDNDGDVDLFCPRYDPGNRGYLWRNDSGTFVDVTVAAGIDDMSGQRSSCWGDTDNDGDLDLYVVTHGGLDNVLYENNGDGTFSVACAGVDAPGDGHDAVFVDFDNDGDLDLAVTQEDDTNVLLENTLSSNQYLLVGLVGAGSTRTPVSANGTRIELWDATGTTMVGRRDLGVARGFGGAEPLRAHFGGVDPAQNYQLHVYFKSGVIAVNVEPQLVSTTIGATTIAQMIMVLEPEPPHLASWLEVQPIP
jgi:hypothetical protein